MKRLMGISVFCLIAVIELSACGGGGGGAATYSVGGTVSGLAAGASVVLQNNGADDLTVTADGAFTFATTVANGGAYAVTVLTQPPNQTCTASSNTGTINGADVTDVSVVCSVNSYSVGGTVSGLGTGKSVVLQNNGADDLTITSNGNFTFTTEVADGAGYSVTVKTQPAGQTCSVSSGAGTIAGANVTDVSVVCSTNTYSVGGTVSGLGAAKSVVLQNNSADDLTVSADGTFAFATKVASGGAYAVTVKTQPVGQTCTPSSGTGTIAAADVANVSVACVDDVYAAGTSTNSTGQSVPGYWKNGTWNELPRLNTAQDSFVGSIVVSGSDVYVGGSNINNSNVATPGYWKNGTWIGLTPLDATKRSRVHSLVISGADVYAGGYSVNSSNVMVPGYWKNGAWTGLPPLDDSNVNSLVVIGADIYAGGSSMNSSGVNVAGYWKNGTWTGLTPLDISKHAGVLSLVVLGTDVYAGGTSQNSSNVYIAGYWKNGTWTGLTSLDTTRNSVVNSVVVAGSDVYAAGYSTNSSVIPVPGYWKNGTWIGLPPLDAAEGSQVISLVISGSDVYAGGSSMNSSGVNVAGYWKNGTWTGLTPLDATMDFEVNALVVGAQ